MWSGMGRFRGLLLLQVCVAVSLLGKHSTSNCCPVHSKQGNKVSSPCFFLRDALRVTETWALAGLNETLAQKWVEGLGLAPETNPLLLLQTVSPGHPMRQWWLVAPWCSSVK